MKPVYLDYAASTPLDSRVCDKMREVLVSDVLFANPASEHIYGQAARIQIEEARTHVASLIHADSSEIIWTSGATESINLALKGAAGMYKLRGKHIVTVKTEHKAVLDTCLQLEKEGYRITYLSPDENGLITSQQVSQAFCEETILVSIMQVNNETGVIQDIQAISTMTSERGILLHVDAAQAVGKIEMNVQKCPIDLLSLSAHKIYGPKGIGALYLRKKPRVRVAPLIHGGGQEQGMRSGTLATHQIVGMGEACRLLKMEMKADGARIAALRDDFLNRLRVLNVFKLNVNLAHTVPHILSVRFENQSADHLLNQLSDVLVASTASACQGRGASGSYVLRAMGFTIEQAKSTIRFSLGRQTSQEEIAMSATQIVRLCL